VLVLVLVLVLLGVAGCGDNQRLSPGWWTVDGATANSNMSLQPILHVEWH
jgi:hypothetical protein